MSLKYNILILKIEIFAWLFVKLKSLNLESRIIFLFLMGELIEVTSILKSGVLGLLFLTII